MTTKKQEILLERMKKYCDQLGVSELPKVVWTLKELMEMPRSIVGKNRAGKRTLGTCYYRDNLIYIAYLKHHNLTSLDNTLRHELIHYRFTGIPHGKRFEKKMKELKQGMTWEAKDRTVSVEKHIEKHADFEFRRFMVSLK